MISIKPWGDAPGQVLVFAAALLGAIMLIGMLVWATLQYRADDATVRDIVRAAALAGAQALDARSLAGDAPGLISCAPAASCAPSAADVRARHALRGALTAAFAQGPTARVSVDDALHHTDVLVYNARLAAPITDPTTGRAYHFPTVCVDADITIGLLEYDGVRFAHHYHDCAQQAS